MFKKKKKQTSGEEIDVDSKKKMLTFFLLFFPSILIAIIPSEINGQVFLSFGIKGCILLYQLVVLKNFIDTHYE